MVAWTLDVDFEYATVDAAITGLTARSKEADWTHLGLTKTAAGKFGLDTDWKFPTLDAALAKITAMAAIAGFTAASVRMAA